MSAVCKILPDFAIFAPLCQIGSKPGKAQRTAQITAKYGIIIKSGEALEKLSRIRRIAFDKTGTLTYGKPQVVNVCSCDTTYSDDDILRFAALVEQKSEHPLGKAICKVYADKNGETENVSDFRMTAAKGVSGTVDGTMIMVGKLIGELDSADKAKVDEQLSTLPLRIAPERCFL